MHLTDINGRRVEWRVRNNFRYVWQTRHAISLYLSHSQAKRFAAATRINIPQRSSPLSEREVNPLQAYFLNHREGPGIWKWNHYFDVYHRHLQKFRGRSPKVLEIGVYSGGSLGMWRDYFGSGTVIYGLDIEPACKAYETDGVKILIGDQGDRALWQSLKKTLPLFDVVIDDGSHLSEHQIVTFEEVLPHMSPGGVYICEDVHRAYSGFVAYSAGLIDSLNHVEELSEDYVDANRRLAVSASPFQAAIQSLCCYPFMTVLELRTYAEPELVAAKRGTQWEPFIT